MQDSLHKLNGGNRTLLAISAAYLLWLLVVLITVGYTPTNDGDGYLEYARYCLGEGSPYPTTSLYSNVPFIWNIGIINLCELSLWLTGSVVPLLVLLCVMKSATALFMSLTARHLFGRRVAVISLLLFVVYPNNWGQSTMLSSEIPSTCLAVVSVYLAVCRRRMFISGLLLALANWFRPTAAIFLVSIVAYIVLCQRRGSLRRVLTMASGYVLFIAIVGTSTLLRTGHFVYQARSYWFSMVDECYDGAVVAPHWGQPIWPEGTPRYIDGHEHMDCFQFERIWRKRSMEWLSTHKLEYMKKIPGRLFYMYQSDYDNIPAFLADKSHADNNYITLPYRHLLSQIRTLSAAQWLSLVCMIMYIGLLVLACLGTISNIRRRQWHSLLLPLLIVCVGTMALIVVMHGETRFKDPLMPYVFIIAATYFYKYSN